MYKRTKKIASTYKYIDSEKASRYVAEHGVVKTALSVEAGYSPNALGQIIKRGYSNIAMWRALCAALGVPEDYFDIVEPERAAEPEPVAEQAETPEDKPDMADIQLSLNQLELGIKNVAKLMEEQIDLMREQNRLLRGRLEKAERSAESRGATNSGEPHSFMIRKEVI